jgi:hypothetical protein
MQLNRVELRIHRIELEHLLCVRHVFGSRHENVAFIKVGPQLRDSLGGDLLIGSLRIELYDRSETDRLEISFLLSFLERILKDDLTIKRPAVLSEWRRGELENLSRSEPFLESAPGRSLSMVGLIDEKIRAKMRHAIPDFSAALAGDATCCDDNVTSAEHLIDLTDAPGDMLKDSDNRASGSRRKDSAVGLFEHPKREEFFGKLRSKSVRRHDD